MLNLKFETLGSNMIISEIDLLQLEINYNKTSEDIQRLSYELNKLVIGFRNATVVKGVVFKYGATEALISLVGDDVDLSVEGLSSGIKTFVSMIIKKIKALIAAIMKLFGYDNEKNNQVKKEADQIKVKITETDKLFKQNKQTIKEVVPTINDDKDKSNQVDTSNDIEQEIKKFYTPVAVPKSLLYFSKHAARLIGGIPHYAEMICYTLHTPDDRWDAFSKNLYNNYSETNTEEVNILDIPKVLDVFNEALSVGVSGYSKSTKELKKLESGLATIVSDGVAENDSTYRNLELELMRLQTEVLFRKNVNAAIRKAIRQCNKLAQSNMKTK